MSLKEERMQVLRMLEEGKINAEEAAQLLSALEIGVGKEEASPGTSPSAAKRRWMRIRVTDGTTGKHRVNVNLPLGVAHAVMKVGSRFVPELKELDLNEMIMSLGDEAQGKIVEVDEDSERVEIFVE
jgi:hypothetical protein